MIFVDTSSTYFEIDLADAEVELATACAEEEARGGGLVGGRARRRPQRSDKPALLQALQGQAPRPAPGGDRHGGDPGGHPGALLDLPR